MPDSSPETDTPFLSVVVPVYNVEAYIRQCLMSVLEQGVESVEVIVVNDQATDRSRAIALEVAELDPRVRVVDNPVNQGLGPSRNNGLAMARGEYVMFLDSDDHLVTGTLAELIRRTQEHRPDLVFYDYHRVYWNDRTARNIRSEILQGADEPITLADRPELYQVLNVAWNKLYRREFLVASGLTFPVGYYEDIPFTYPVLALAQSILLHDEAVIAYRQRRTGSILRSHDRRHLEVLDQVERTFAVLDAHPELDPWRGAIWDRCCGHTLTVLAIGRLPGEHRSTFFRQAAALLARTRPDGHPIPSGPRGVKVSLLVRNRYALFSALKFSNSVRLRVRRVPTRIKRFARQMIRFVRTARVPALKRAIRQSGYRFHRRMPLDENLVVFYALWGRPPCGNTAAIDAALAEFAPGMRSVWMVRAGDADKVPEGTSVVVVGSPQCHRALARAKYLVSDVNFPDHVEKRPGQVMLETQHGTPLKYMGLDMQRHPIPASKMNFGKLLKRVDNWNFNLSSNPYSTEVWRRAFPSRYTMLEFGYPRNDRLVRADAQTTADMRAALGIPSDHFVVLYAPTHRDYRDGFEADLDVADLMAALPESTTVIVRGHYFYAGATGHAVQSEQRLIDLSEHPHIEDLYIAADVLITDYSSAMFDFAVLDRPIVIFAPDWDRYRTERGTYFDIMAEPPGAAVTTQEDLVALFRSGGQDTDDTRALRDVFRQRFCGFDDGRSAERVVRHVFLGAAVEAPASGAVPPLRTWVTDRAG
jgi:CDP-glycerol glycerophosphotransferase (TagB/SpsB family)